MSVLGFCLVLYLSLNFALLEHPQDQLVQTLKKTGSRMPLRMKKAALVCSNYIPRTFNPCGDVTVSYLLWCSSLVPRPPPTRERVWWHQADTSGFINIHYFLERKYLSANHIAERQSVVQHRKFLASSARWHSTFLARKLVIGSQLCIQQAMNF